MSHAFVSYVKDDANVVDYIVAVLRENNVEVWLDKDSLQPGARWRDSIRNAIRSGKLFIPVFSKSWEAREKTYANEEIILAIEELRLRPTDRSWFVPIKIDDCNIPDRNIGGGETLSDIQYIDFTKGWSKSIQQLLKIAGVVNPKIEIGEPLGAGLSSIVDIVSGALVATRTIPTISHSEGMIFSITGGWITRSKEDKLLAYISTQAPSIQMQELNIRLGTDSFYAVSSDGYISNNPNKLNRFAFSNELVVEAGTDLWDIQNAQHISFPFDIKAIVNWTADGYLKGNSFIGNAESKMSFFIGNNEQTAQLFLEFRLDLRNSD